MDDLEFKRQYLDTKSTSFCAAKWYNATIWLGSGQTTSCHHPPAHPIDANRIVAHPSAIHNTLQKKQDRKMMIYGERPAGCEYCWKIEDMGRDAISDRVYKSRIYSTEELQAAFEMDPAAEVNLRTLEIAFDRTCQLACSYCNPAFSTTWVRDIKTHGAYQNLLSDGRNHFTHAHDSAQLYKFGQTNPYVDAFFEWWESDLHQTLHELRITGGEPLMSAHTWRLIEWFRNNPGRSKTRLAINSNLSMDSDRVQDLLDACEGIELDIYTSNESMTTQAEYIRDGLSWEQWVDNMWLLMRSGRLRGLHVMNTINALCLDSLPEFLTMLVDWKTQWGADFPNFTLNILRFPSFQSALVLPDELRLHYRDRLSSWLNQYGNYSVLQQHEKNHVQRLIDYLDVVKTPHSEAFDLPRLRHDFREFYRQYDQRRNKDFTATFLRMAEWYNTL